jgi:hypothetical protein
MVLQRPISDGHSVNPRMQSARTARLQGTGERFSVRFRRVGESTRGGGSLTIGARHEHYDYNF